MKRLTIGDFISIMREYNIAIHTWPLHGSSKGISMKMHEGYLVLVEETMCYPSIVETIQHELCHIMMGHLDDDVKSEAQKEKEVDAILNKIKKENCHGKEEDSRCYI